MRACTHLALLPQHSHSLDRNSFDVSALARDYLAVCISASWRQGRSRKMWPKFEVAEDLEDRLDELGDSICFSLSSLSSRP